jgi:hypothetical protein
MRGWAKGQAAALGQTAAKAQTGATATVDAAGPEALLLRAVVLMDMEVPPLL